MARWMWRFRADGPMTGTPLVAAGTVFGTSEDGHVYALDAATGRLRWRFRWLDKNLGWFPPPIAYVTGTLLVGTQADTGQSAVHGLDPHTGQVRWRHEVDGRRWVLGVGASEGAVVASCGDHLRCLDPSGGTIRWIYPAQPVPSSRRWRTPVVADGLVVAPAGVRTSAATATVAYTEIQAIDLATGSPRWDVSVDGNDVHLAVVDGVVYVGTRAGLVAAVVADTGDQRWRVTMEARRTLSWHPTGMRRFDPDAYSFAYIPVSAAMSTPVVTADGVYSASENGRVYRFAIDTGAVRYAWDAQIRAMQVCAAGPLVYAGYFNGQVVALPGTGGGPVWSRRLRYGRIYGLASVAGTLYVSAGAHLLALDAATGAGPWPWSRLTERIPR